MKRILLILTLCLTFSGVAYAAGINGQYKGHDIVNVTYEGQKITPSDVPAFLFDERTLVPLDMLRKVGFDVGWNQDTLTADITPAKPETVHTVKTLDQIESLQNCIALIYGLDDSGVRRWQGSGFMLNSHGLLITANHVLQDDKGNDMDLEIILNGKTYRVPKGVTAFRDKDKDIAGIYLYDKEKFPYLKVGELPEVGDKVYSIGYPQEKLSIGYRGETTYAIDSDKVSVIDTDEQFIPGQSGGALINQYGEVIGVTIRTDSDYSMINESIPISFVERLYKQSLNK